MSVQKTADILGKVNIIHSDDKSPSSLVPFGTQDSVSFVLSVEQQWNQGVNYAGFFQDIGRLLLL